MGIGAIGNDISFYGNASTQKNSRAEQYAKSDICSGVATKETTSSNDGKTIGIMTVGSNGYLAKIADSSTPADPVVKVGKYEVKINDVDPSNATQLEMFAWTSYMEHTGQIEKHGMSSYSKMKTYAAQSQYDGVCSGIYDGGSNESDFWNKKQNWRAIIENAKNTYASMKETYSQSLECGKLLSYFESWASRVNEKQQEQQLDISDHKNEWAENLSCRVADESTAEDPVYEVTTRINGKEYSEKVHVNDVMPSKATQQEMYAFFEQHDLINGSEGSYEKFMAFMDTAKTHGYWEGNDTYEQFTTDTHNWRDILPKVWGDAYSMGMYGVNSDGIALSETMEKAFITKLEFDPSKATQREIQTKSNISWPDIPQEMGNVLYESFSRWEGKAGFGDGLDGANNLFSLELSIEYRISKQMDADGTRGTAGMWDSAISVLESAMDELDKYFVDGLGNLDSAKEEIAGLKKMYQSIIDDLQKSKAAASAENEEPVQGEEDYLKSLLLDHIAEMYEKIRNGDTEQEFQIGSMSLTLDEWDKLIEKFDDLEAELKEAIRAEIERVKEAQASNSEKPVEKIDGNDFLTSEIRKTVFKEATEDKPELSYITCFTEDGIICKRTGMSEEEYLWKIDYEDEQEYEKVMSLLNSFPDDWDLRFTPNEKFWKDYLAERIDKDEFVSNITQFSDKGRMNYFIEKDGNTYIDREAAKYSNYMNNPEDRIYTLQEFTEIIANQLSENQKKLVDPSDEEAIKKIDEMMEDFKRHMLGAAYNKTYHVDYFSDNYIWRANNDDEVFNIFSRDGELISTIKYFDLSNMDDDALASEFGYNEELLKTISHVLDRKIEIHQEEQNAAVDEVA